MITTLNEDGLDKEWIELILQAFQIGVSIDEIRDFLKHNSSLQV